MFSTKRGNFVHRAQVTAHCIYWRQLSASPEHVRMTVPSRSHMWKTANLTTVGYHSRFLKLTFQSMDNVIDLCSSPEDHSLSEQFRFCEQFLDELQENDVVNKVSTLQSDGKVYPLNLVRMNGQPQKRKRLSISKGHKAL